MKGLAESCLKSQSAENNHFLVKVKLSALQSGKKILLFFSLQFSFVLLLAVTSSVSARLPFSRDGHNSSSSESDEGSSCTIVPAGTTICTGVTGSNCTDQDNLKVNIEFDCWISSEVLRFLISKYWSSQFHLHYKTLIGYCLRHHYTKPEGVCVFSGPKIHFDKSS